VTCIWGPGRHARLQLAVGLALLVLVGRPGAAVSNRGPVFEATVVKVADGDSITVLRGEEEVRIRLEGIDCPEHRQPYSVVAKKFTSGMVFQQRVTVRVLDRDRYGREVARVTKEGRDVSVELLRAGLAWHYKSFNQEEELARLETEARQTRRGLWADPHPIPPWQWRRTHPRN